MEKFRIQIAGSVTGTHTNFPVYVDLANMPAEFWALVTNGGGDIRCYSDSALTTELAREVVSCNTSTDVGELHVKVPSFSSSSEIWVTVDGTSSEPSAGSTYGKNAVWSDYVGVWHLGESSGNALDATSNGHNLTDTNTVGVATGKISGGRNFVSANTEYFTINDNASLSLGNNDLTISAWIKTASTGSVQPIVGKGWDNGTASNREFQLDIRADNTRAQLQLYDTGFKQVNNSTFGALSTGTWYYLAGRHNNSANTIEVRVNTTDSGTTSVGTPRDGTRPFRIGANDSASPVFNGDIDEVRYRKGYLSNDWLSAEYTNQNNPATFFTITYIPSEITDDRSAELIGKQDTNNTRDSELHGKVSDASTKDSEISGVETLNNDRESELTGFLVDNNAREAELFGSIFSDDSKSSELHGNETTNNAREAELLSANLADDSRDSEIIGFDSSFDERNSELNGLATDNNSRDSEIMGILESEENRSASLEGWVEPKGIIYGLNKDTNTKVGQRANGVGRNKDTGTLVGTSLLKK